jgi:hypothetical protein
MDTVTRFFCSCACLAAYALKLSHGELAEEGVPWAGYHFNSEAQERIA